MTRCKRNPAYSARTRALRILAILLSRRYPVTQSELAEDLDCSPSTISRTMTILEAEFGSSLVVGKEGKSVTYFMKKDSNLFKISLDTRGLIHLALCLELFGSTLPQVMSDSASRTLEYAGAKQRPNSPEKDPKNIPGAFLKNVNSFEKGYINYGNYHQLFHTVTSCISKNNVMEVTYIRHIGKEPKTYLTAPKRLVLFNRVWYVLCWVVTEDEIPQCKYENPIYLLLHRIQKAEKIRRNTTELKAIPLSNDAFGFMQGKPFPVKVRFYGCEAITYIADRIWSKDQKINFIDADTMEITFTATSREEVKSWVLGFGKSAELLEPEELKEKIREEILSMAKRWTPPKANDNA